MPSEETSSYIVGLLPGPDSSDCFDDRVDGAVTVVPTGFSTGSVCMNWSLVVSPPSRTSARHLSSPMQIPFTGLRTCGPGERCFSVQTCFPFASLVARLSCTSSESFGLGRGTSTGGRTSARRGRTGRSSGSSLHGSGASPHSRSTVKVYFRKSMLTLIIAGRSCPRRSNVKLDIIHLYVAAQSTQNINGCGLIRTTLGPRSMLKMQHGAEGDSMDGRRRSCGHCSFTKQKCLPECSFAHFFPPDKREDYAAIHNFFGPKCISYIVNNVEESLRVVAINNLVYEAKAWINNPVHGCMAEVNMLKEEIKELRLEVYRLRRQEQVELLEHDDEQEYPQQQQQLEQVELLEHDDQQQQQQELNHHGCMDEIKMLKVQIEELWLEIHGLQQQLQQVQQQQQQ
ncbi:hypothetical protein J5N97_014302 [Dioscorea zingiberensis]|uniref:LOB domain-containing protein n=1 Tax=Dioscorea zingiberensis TaxID=325984 RepID=A0A9D5HJN0_9LILI|nr:hypothetical protein J5N97_014302 [Dioscorea zingiberensis]